MSALSGSTFFPFNNLLMVFHCPHCQFQNPNQVGQTHCTQCNQPLYSLYEEPAKSGNRWLILLLGCGGAAFLVAVMVVVGLVMYALNGNKPAVAAFNNESTEVAEAFDGDMPADAKAAFSRRPRSTPAIPLDQVAETYAEFPVPAAGEVRSLKWANVYTAKFGGHLKTFSARNPPGCRMSVRMYFPVDLSEGKKIPCVLLAPAGSNLLTGKDCDKITYTDEIKPYVAAGMAVLHYSLDGSLDKISERRQEEALSSRSGSFCKAHGGVINGQRAIDFALKNFDQIDPSKLYCAGHSSAGTLSLQLASTDKRISRCIAYAPAPSLEKRFADLFNQEGIDATLPWLRMYVKQWSPGNRVSKFHCPVFIFQARDDSNTPYLDTKAFHDQLTAAGKNSKLETVNRGGHYQAMIDEGIPAAIEWLKSFNAH